MPVQDAMVVLRKTAFAMMNYVSRCCTPDEARRPTEHFDEEVLKYLCEIQRVQRSELTALTVEEMHAQPIDASVLSALTEGSTLSTLSTL